MNKTIINNNNNIDIHFIKSGYMELNVSDWKTMVFNQLENEIYNDWYMELLRNTEKIIDNIYNMYEKQNDIPVKILLYDNTKLYMIDIINMNTGEIIYINSI